MRREGVEPTTDSYNLALSACEKALSVDSLFNCVLVCRDHFATVSACGNASEGAIALDSSVTQQSNSTINACEVHETSCEPASACESSLERFATISACANASEGAIVLDSSVTQQSESAINACEFHELERSVEHISACEPSLERSVEHTKAMRICETAIAHLEELEPLPTGSEHANFEPAKMTDCVPVEQSTMQSLVLYADINACEKEFDAVMRACETSSAWANDMHDDYEHTTYSDDEPYISDFEFPPGVEFDEEEYAAMLWRSLSAKLLRQHYAACVALHAALGRGARYNQTLSSYLRMRESVRVDFRVSPVVLHVA